MKKIISIATQKGGVSKTTTAISLSAGLARRGKKVLLIDIDQQANASKALLPHYSKIPRNETIFATLMELAPLPVHPTGVEGLFVTPGHILLSDTDLKLATEFKREERLKRQVDRIKDQFDYVFIDLPPALGLQSINALTASDGVLVVVAPGYFELDSLIQMTDVIRKVQDQLNPTLEFIGFLFTKSEPTINSRESLEMLRSAYGDKVLKTIVPRNTDIRDALFHNQDIFEFNPKASSAMAYAKLIEEVFLS